MKIQVNLSFDTDDLEAFDANLRRLSQLIDRLLGSPDEIGQSIINGIKEGITTPSPSLVAAEPRDVIVWSEPLRDVAVRLNAGHTTWRKIDRSTRKALAIQVLRNLIERGYCTMPEFDRRRPTWMPKALSLVMSFGLKWTELVDDALSGRVSQMPLSVTGANTDGTSAPPPARSSTSTYVRERHVQQTSTTATNGQHEPRRRL
jgi:hypothetical protein